jgi:hypothetical protein
MEKRDDLIEELNIIEAKHWQHFKNSVLSDDYDLREDKNHHLTFSFKRDSDIPLSIREECLAIFKIINRTKIFAKPPKPLF